MFRCFGAVRMRMPPSISTPLSRRAFHSSAVNGSEARAARASSNALTFILRHEEKGIIIDGEERRRDRAPRPWAGDLTPRPHTSRDQAGILTGKEYRLLRSLRPEMDAKFGPSSFQDRFPANGNDFSAVAVLAETPDDTGNAEEVVASKRDTVGGGSNKPEGKREEQLKMPAGDSAGNRNYNSEEERRKYVGKYRWPMAFVVLFFLALLPISIVWSESKTSKDGSDDADDQC